MAYALAVAAIIFIGLSGRNDGGPLLALPYRTERRGAWVPLLFLFLTVPAVAYFGSHTVAESLAALFTPGGGTSGPSAGAAFAALLAVLVTLAVAAWVNAPTSITLALIGSLSGSSLALGKGLDTDVLLRVVTLGLAAPFVAALLSYLLARLPVQKMPGGRHSGRVLAWSQRLAFFLLLTAYGLNDGQKVLFAVALALGVSVNEAVTSVGWVFAASAVFVAGALLGVRQSSQFVRHGIARVKPIPLLWAQLASAGAVFSGSALGTPLSMTQSISGALVGSGLARSRRAVYWKAIGRIGLAWVWTLPMAGAVSYVVTWGGVLILK